MKPSSRAEYLQRIDRVVERLAHSIAQEGALPTIAELARCAHLSEFHFMRIYRALAGESLGATIQRLRLQRAVHLLTDSSATIGDIAARVGYETPQAFAKAFRVMFNATPSDVRERPDRYIGELATIGPPKPAFGLKPVIRVEIIGLQPFQVAVLRNHGDYADLDRAYAALFNWMAARGALETVTGIWGIPHHDRRDTASDDCVFDCCLSTSARLPDEAPVHMMQLGGGLYATHKHIGSYALLDNAHDALLQETLSTKGLSLREVPILHRFMNDPEVTSEAELETYIYIPIEQATAA